VVTAHDLIDSIFRRPAWKDEPGNLRHVTRAQLDYLRRLIDANPEGGAVMRGMGDSLVWMPMGRDKYVLTEDPRGNKHTLMRLANIVPSEAGRLF
jgi:hypothetical protein